MSYSSMVRWLGLAVLVLPCLLFSMDLTMLSLALPQVTAAFQLNDAQRLLVADISTLCVALGLITAGYLGDRFGHRRILLGGMMLIGAGSVLAAFANGASEIITGRALVGLGAATIAPATLALLRQMFVDVKSQRMAMGAWVASLSLGGAIGPLLGGLLLQHFWWGSAFLLGLPVAVVVLVLGRFVLPTHPKGPSKKSISGSLLRVPALRRALVLQFAIFFVNFPVFIAASQYLQSARHQSAMQTGIWLLASGIGFIGGATTSGQIISRVGTYKTAIASCILAAMGFVLLTFGAYGLPLLLAGLFIYSLALAYLISIGAVSTLNAVPPSKAGLASGIGQTAVQLGGACGIVVIGTISDTLAKNELWPAGAVSVLAMLTLAAYLVMKPPQYHNLSTH